MADIQVTLTTEERQCLQDVLQEILKETQIEEHRTRAPSYRKLVVRQEELIAQVLRKLQPAKT